VNQVEELERAILARAERLANEYRERANRSRDNILREAAEKLRLREQREEAIAKALGERTFRQKVQASEQKMQSHLDQVRWNLVRDVEGRLTERMQAFMDNEIAYLAHLQGLIRQSAQVIERDDLIVEANARDLKRLEAHWQQRSTTAAADKRLTLATDPIDVLGGVVVRDTENRIRVDNSFEGRLERLRPKIQQTILERLLPNGFETGNIFSG